MVCLFAPDNLERTGAPGHFCDNQGALECCE